MGTSTDKYQKKKKQSSSQKQREERLRKLSELNSSAKHQRNILGMDQMNTLK